MKAICSDRGDLKLITFYLEGKETDASLIEESYDYWNLKHSTNDMVSVTRSGPYANVSIKWTQTTKRPT